MKMEFARIVILSAPLVMAPLQMNVNHARTINAYIIPNASRNVQKILCATVIRSAPLVVIKAIIYKIISVF